MPSRSREARPGLAVGVHLVLTEHRPLIGASAAASLVEPDGRFPPHLKQLLGKRLRGRVSLAEVRLELDAQIRRVQRAGIAVSHLDGHQHVHVLPGIAGIVAELAAAHGIARRALSGRARARLHAAQPEARAARRRADGARPFLRVVAAERLAAQRRFRRLLFRRPARRGQSRDRARRACRPAAPSSSCAIRATRTCSLRAIGSTPGPRSATR